MTSPRLTGSGIERVAICAGAGVLPRVETVTDDASRGHQIHAFLEAVNRQGREAALAAVPDDLRAACEALDVAKLPTDPARFAAEVAFSYDPETGRARELGRGIGRRYEVNGGEIAGTADVVALLEDDGVFVADFKSGWSRRARARDSHQLRFYALAAARAYGRSRAVVQVIRVFEDGETWTDEASLDAFDLDSYALDLAALVSMVEAHRIAYEQGEDPPLVEGAHCRWCPCYSRCPAKTTLLRAAALEAPAPSELTPEVAARAYERLRVYKAAVGKAEEILREYARANPIPLPDGLVYGVRLDATKKIDGRVAQSYLREVLGDAADEAVTVEVTQAGIKRALEAAGRRPAELKSVLEALRARGGLRETTAPKLVEHAPKGAA